jgi:hypothetical protein
VVDVSGGVQAKPAVTMLVVVPGRSSGSAPGRPGSKRL